MKESLREVDLGVDHPEEAADGELEADREVENEEEECVAQGVFPEAEDLAVDLEGKGFSIKQIGKRCRGLTKVLFVVYGHLV